MDRTGPLLGRTVYELVDMVSEEKPRPATVAVTDEEIMKRVTAIAENMSRELFPAIAERIIREEIAKLKNEQGPGERIRRRMLFRKFFLHVPGPFCVIALIVTASFLLATPLWSAGDVDTLAVDVEGIGIIERQNLSQAREKAIEDALAQALKAAMTSVLLPGLPPLKFQEAWRRISDKQADYIQKYGITGESSDHTAYRVRVNATLFVDAIAERLRSLGYETVPKDHVDKEITLTVRDVRSYEEYLKLHEFLEDRMFPVFGRSGPARFSWKEVSFHLILRGTSGCVTEARLPFDVQKMADNEITGVMNHQE